MLAKLESSVSSNSSGGEKSSREATYRQCEGGEKRDSSIQVIEGTWKQISKFRGNTSTPQFVPGSLESAKSFLRSAKSLLKHSMDSGRQNTAVNTCHGCHGPVGSGAHMGSVIGKARCSLPHHILCRGNIIEDSSWRSCPPNYVFDPNLVVSNTGFESTLNPSAFNFPPQRRSTPLTFSPNHSDKNVLQASNSLQPVDDGNPKQFVSSGPVNTEDNKSSPVQAQSNGFSDLPVDLQAQIEKFRSQNQAKNQAQVQDNQHDNLNINSLRADQELRKQVELVLTAIKERVPSLAPAPNAGQQVTQSVSHSQYLNNGTQEGQEGYEWVMDSKGNRHLVNTCGEFVTSNQKQQSVNRYYQPSTLANRGTTTSYRLEYKCSPTSGRVWQEKVPVEVTPTREPTFRTEYRCSPTTGKVWQGRVPVPENQVSPQGHTFKWEWRINPQTGEKYQVQVPSVTWSSNLEQVHAFSQSETSLHDQRTFNDMPESYQLHSNPNHAENQSSLRTFEQEISGISKLDKNSGRKNSRIVDLAKQCPAKWAKTTTLANINLPLYTWASVNELEAAMSGRTNALSEGEILGKLRHIKCILEVCCLNSSATDFNTYGWTIARDYASKVDDEVTHGLVKWDEVTPGVRTSALVLAQMDCQRQSSAKLNKKEGDAVRICTTYNKCETKGKCDYEVNNPGKTCQRKHECSWCRSNLNQGNRHQAWECKKKES